MEEQTVKFESWAIVEIFGHIKLAGMCTTQNFGNTVLLRVDIPETARHPQHSQLYGMSSIFSLKPCDEATARAHAESWQVEPIIEYDVRISVNKQAQAMAQQIIDGRQVGAGRIDDDHEEEHDEDGNPF